MYYFLSIEEGDMLPQIDNDMKTPERQTQDEVLEQMHNEYLDEIAECGLPMYVIDMYGMNPLNVMSSQNKETPRCIECGQVISNQADQYCSSKCYLGGTPPQDDLPF